MVSTRPYLIRAIYEWCVDQGFTPYIAVQVDQNTRVPSGYVREGQIVLNIGSEATHQLKINNEQVTFQARFNGVAHQIAVPVGNVSAIYARENGQGMVFEMLDARENTSVGKAPDSAEAGTEEPPDDSSPPPASPRSSHLKVIK
ncbi:MAG: ClpXP protease specificity-enhancing factor [Azoarcus sp.]|jgi:stringent starvation protein B|nr:ClpXP protease specificity-enhancing factor [Azoarcus sp.]